MKPEALQLKPESLPQSGLGPDGKLKIETEHERRQRLEAARLRLREIADIPDAPDDRELTRVGASGSLRRLDALVTTGQLTYAPITTLEWRQAAVFWADARRRGLPTASPEALDADVILAACAATIGHPGDHIIVATMNVGDRALL